MKHLNWGWIFAGLSAIAGVAYVLHQNAQQPVQSVTNVFPPINTPDMSVLGSDSDEPTEPATIASQTQAPAQQTKLTPYPVFSV